MRDSLQRNSHTPRNWVAVVAISQNNVIGKGNQLPWRLSSDLQRFKRLTMGECLLMGRKTFQSIGRPLPGRQTIVLSRSGFVSNFAEVTVVGSLDEVSAAVQESKQVVVIGGAEIFKKTIDFCDQMWITRVLANVDGDVSFPAIQWSDWQLTESQAIDAGPRDQWPTRFERWRRNLSGCLSPTP